MRCQCRGLRAGVHGVERGPSVSAIMARVHNGCEAVHLLPGDHRVAELRDQ